MNKVLVSLMFVFGLVGATSAFADNVKGPVYTCSISGDISGGSIAIIFGAQYIKGPGVISCRNNFSGERSDYPVTLRLAGAGVGLELARIDSIKVRSAGIGINDPRFFMQSYALGATAGVSLFNAGVDFDAAVRVSHGGAGFELGFQGKDVKGLGVHLYAMSFRIKARN